MNFTQLAYIYLLAISLFCYGSDQQLAKYRSIGFNSEIGIPTFVSYIGDKSLAIVGYAGFEIRRDQHSDYDILMKGSPGEFWHISKDAGGIVVFDEKDIYIKNLGGDIKKAKVELVFKGRENITNGSECIRDIAIDSVKNVIFIGCNRTGNKGTIIQHNYNTNLTRYFPCNNNASFLSLALSSQKDILCVLDNYHEISLRKTDAIGVVFKTIKLKPFVGSCDSCIFSPHDNNLILQGSTSSVYVLDWESDAAKGDVIDPITHDSIYRRLDCSDHQSVINSIAFHPCGLLAVLLSSLFTGSSIQYWDTKAQKKLDTTIIPKTKGPGLDFCFGNDGLELAMTTTKDCIKIPVSAGVIKHYVVPSLWMKLKTIQKQYNLPQNVIKHCIHTLIAYSQNC